jgi:hypothetical protein
MISFEAGRPTQPPFVSSRYQLRRLHNLSTQGRLLYQLAQIPISLLPMILLGINSTEFMWSLPNNCIPADTGMTSSVRVSTASWAGSFRQGLPKPMLYSSYALSFLSRRTQRTVLLANMGDIWDPALFVVDRPRY